MNRERISRLINFDDGDTSTGFVGVNGGSMVNVSGYLDILETLRSAINKQDIPLWYECVETFTEKFCRQFGYLIDDEGNSLLVYEFTPNPRYLFSETEKWKETIKGIWTDCREDMNQHENTGLILTYHNYKEPFYKLYYPVLDYANRRYDYAWDNARTIYDYFKTLIEHIRRNGQ